MVFGLWKNTLWVDCGEKPELGILLVKKSVSLLEKKLRYKKNCFGNSYHFHLSNDKVSPGAKIDITLLVKNPKPEFKGFIIQVHKK